MNRKKLADKFFTNQTTPGETRQVLEWFETPEGKRYLAERLDVDAELMSRRELGKWVPELDSAGLYDSIRREIGKKKVSGGRFSPKRHHGISYVLKAAAVFLVMAAASWFAISYEQYMAAQEPEREPVAFRTGEDQHREISLGDGTVVRMNSSSEMVVSADFMQGTREITLSGEAYFDVAHDPEHPFVIHANEASVEVLGTSFNVRSLSGQENVQVAVVDGKVAFRSINRTPETEQLSVTLSKGQYGYMDISERTILVDDLAVENYLAWKNGRFIFEGLTLNQVCTQLGRIYGAGCRFEDDEIKTLRLTSNFSNDTLEKTVEVIALSLELEYEIGEGEIYWKTNT